MSIYTQFVLGCKSTDVTITGHIYHNISQWRVWGVLVSRTIGLEDVTWNIAPPLQLLCAWYVCMCGPGGWAAQLHETDNWPRDRAAIWLDLTCVVHNLTAAWPLCPVARDRHLTWESSQLCTADIWPGNLPRCTRQTFDLGIYPVARERHWTWEVAVTHLDYMCDLCVSVLNPRRVALAKLLNRQPPSLRDNRGYWPLVTGMLS